MSAHDETADCKRITVGDLSEAYDRGKAEAPREWLVAIPEPYYGIRKKCMCGRHFWTYAGYQGHWLLEHQWRNRGYLVGDMLAVRCGT